MRVGGSRSNYCPNTYKPEHFQNYLVYILNIGMQPSLQCHIEGSTMFTLNTFDR